MQRLYAEFAVRERQECAGQCVARVPVGAF
jgi:hypothetical protein